MPGAGDYLKQQNFSDVVGGNKKQHDNFVKVWQSFKHLLWILEILLFTQDKNIGPQEEELYT